MKIGDGIDVAVRIEYDESTQNENIETHIIHDEHVNVMNRIVVRSGVIIYGCFKDSWDGKLW